MFLDGVIFSFFIKIFKRNLLKCVRVDFFLILVEGYYFRFNLIQISIEMCFFFYKCNKVNGIFKREFKESIINILYFIRLKIVVEKKLVLYFFVFLILIY